MTRLLETPYLERLPPHSLESEMCVIGALILAGADRVLTSDIRAAVTAEMFFQADHQILYDVICRLIDERGGCDAMLIREELLRRRLLEEVGGLEYLGLILNSVPSPSNGPHYAADVREKYGWRRLIQLSNDTLRRSYAPHEREDLAAAAAELASAAAELVASTSKSGIVSLGEVAAKVVKRRGNPEVRRIKTGLRELDGVIGGLPITKFTIVGSDPRIGKSMLIKQIGLNVSGRGVGFGLVTVEEDREKVAENMLAAVSNVANHRIAHGNMEPHEWEAVEGGALKLAGLPFYIEDSVDDLPSIRTAIQRLALKHGCKVVAVDHIHIIDGQDRDREREVSKISGGLKQEFKRLQVAGIAAAQFNRGERAQKEKPILRNLRDSKALEADGDLILLLHREDAHRYNEAGYTLNHRLEINVAKNKDGQMAEIPAHFDGAAQTVRDWDVVDPFCARAPSYPNFDDDVLGGG